MDKEFGKFEVLSNGDISSEFYETTIYTEDFEDLIKAIKFAKAEVKE